MAEEGKEINGGRIATIREIDQQRYSHSQEDIEELKEDDNLSDDLQSNYVKQMQEIIPSCWSEILEKDN